MISRRTETKYGSITGTSGVTTGAPTVGLLFGALLPGVGVGQRIGQRVTLVSLRLRHNFEASAAGPSRLRIMLIRDKDCQGALPPAGAVDWMLDKTLANAYASFLDPVTVRSRYQVLYDKTVNCNIQGGGDELFDSESDTDQLETPPQSPV